MLTTPRHSSRFLTPLAFVTLAAVTPTVVAVVAVSAAEPPDRDARIFERHLSQAREALVRSSWAKAERAFEKALAVDAECDECWRGLVRANAGRGRWEAAAQWAGALLDTRESETDLNEIENVFRRGMEGLGDADPNLLWGWITVLGRLGHATEIALLADRHLDTPEKRALVCAADSRPSLDGSEAPAIAAELNGRLRDIGWPGPFLAAGQVRRPRVRVPVYREAARGFRMMGVVDTRGLLGEVRLIRPPPAKVGPMVWDEIRRTLFDPATWRGRRISSCLPFTVQVPDLSPPGSGAAAGVVAGGFFTEPLPLYVTVGGMASARDILELVVQAGPGVTPAQRAAICAARSGFEELNDGLRDLAWWQAGPFLDTEAIDDPVPRDTPTPDYTDAARAASVEGRVVVSAVIDAAGRVAHAEALEGLEEGLTENALEALRQWSFQPAAWEGETVSVCRRITFTFDLEAGGELEEDGE